MAFKRALIFVTLVNFLFHTAACSSRVITSFAAGAGITRMPHRSYNRNYHLQKRGSSRSIARMNGQSGLIYITSKLIPTHFGINAIHSQSDDDNSDEKSMERGAEIEAKKDNGMPPLHYAAQKGQLETVTLLLDKGANVEAKSKYGLPPLLYATDLEVIRLLLDRGANVEGKTDCTLTPLHNAAMYGHSETVALLLDRGAGIEAKNEYGMGPLHYAASMGRLETATLLLDKGANAEAKDNDDVTPFGCATENGHDEVAELLRNRGAEKAK